MIWPTIVAISMSNDALQQERQAAMSAPPAIHGGGYADLIPASSPQIHRLLFQHATPPTIAIFFHIYVPTVAYEEKTGDYQSRIRGINIIREQLKQVWEGLASIPNMHQVKLFYTTVGQGLEEGHVERICNELSSPDLVLSCHHLQHVDSGFEEYTLTALHEYCVENEEHRAIYLHTKGSYHASKEQHRRRQHMTDAITSRHCIERAHSEGCDLCGLIFLPRPSLHFTGNMFNAKCSYIRKLAKPMEFQEKMSSVVETGRKLLANGTLASNLMNEEALCNNGLERFAMEHWHGSHPSLAKVCDLSSHYSQAVWDQTRRRERKEEDWHFGVFPRHPPTAAWSHGYSNKLVDHVMDDESKRKREYFLLPGQLMRWYELYGEFPPSSSWVWSWYPDGQFWKEMVQEHGGNALEVAANMTRSLSRS